ncbi:glycosyltransferase [Candidatus Woesearchaeota archaeon]|nr:glycosyltransferase [Candidatus Woesearchaeota archaeon]
MNNVKDIVDVFFIQYNTWGRLMLDYLHSVFNTAFTVLLITTASLSFLYLILSAYSLLKKREKSHLQTPEKLPFVTVQIPTYNELAALRCAKRCLEFDYPVDKYEILIGDDSNTNEISSKIDKFAETNNKVKIFRRGANSGYKSGNLNNLLKHSKGEIIVIFDSDFIPPKDFISEIVKPFSNNPHVAGVQAKWNFINADQNLVSSLGSTIVEVFQRVTLPFMFHRKKLAFLCGSAEAVRKDILIKLGGWEHGNLTEDIEYSLRLIKNGYKIVYLEDLKCDSEVPYIAKDLYRQQMRWAYGVVTSYKGHAKELFQSSKLSLSDKIYTTLICSGYLLTILLASLFIMGMLSVVTHPPSPIDIVRFFSETARNTIITSGLVIASAAAIAKSKRRGHIAKMLVSSFTYGLVVTYYVNIGIIKAIFKKPMEWYMLNKIGNIRQ